MNVALIGASDKEDRYSNKAFKLLREHNHAVFPVHKRVKEIEGVAVFNTVNDITEPIDTVTLYVAADVSERLADDILALKPRRIIFNPGAENPALVDRAGQAGIECINGCTLVMLNTDQF